MLRRSKLKAWPAVLLDVIIYSSGTVHFCMLSLHPFNLHNKSGYGIDHYQSYRSPYFLVHDPSLIRSRCCLVGCRRHSRLRSKTHAKKVKAQPSPVWLRLVQEGAFTFFVGGRAVCHNKCQVFVTITPSVCSVFVCKRVGAINSHTFSLFCISLQQNRSKQQSRFQSAVFVCTRVRASSSHTFSLLCMCLQQSRSN